MAKRKPLIRKKEPVADQPGQQAAVDPVVDPAAQQAADLNGSTATTLVEEPTWEDELLPKKMQTVEEPEEINATTTHSVVALNNAQVLGPDALSPTAKKLEDGAKNTTGIIFQPATSTTNGDHGSLASPPVSPML